MKKISVMIVDDSAVVRQVLSDILSADRHISIMAVASDPIYAMEKMQSKKPDVIVLDIEMPRMDGITFLRKIMAEQPTPVVICSTLTEQGAATTIQALEAGAISIVTKPKMGLKNFLEDSSNNIVATVKAAASANVGNLRKSFDSRNQEISKNALNANTNAFKLQKTTDSIVAMGTSTGGTQALEHVLSELPRVSPGIVIVQHMPEKFTAAFAQRLNNICEIEVKEATTNDRVIPGRALVAPGGKHMMLERSGAQYHVKVIEGPPVNRHIPSVDVLFRSVAKVAGQNALGIIMTGMGNDGAAGLLEMRNENAYTIAQDEASSIVFGMPKEAINCGAAEKVVPLSNISRAIMSWSTVQDK